MESDALTYRWGATYDCVHTGQLLVSGGELVAHQLPGEASSLSCSEILCQGQKGHYSAIDVGQPSATYVNKLGGTVSPRLNAIVRDLWLWCMNRGITMSAEHFPVVLNTVADELFRHSFRSSSAGAVVDLFVSRLTTQLQRSAGDQTQRRRLWMLWTQLQGKTHVNPPWNLVGRVLNRVCQQKITLVLVVPVWKSYNHGTRCCWSAWWTLQSSSLRRWT
jgi:hypothetical protein